MQQSLADMSSIIHEKDYYVERLTGDRLKDLEFLYKEVYGKMVPKNYFRIKYDTAYTGHQYVGFIAYNKDHLPIAYYGTIPCFLQCEGEKIIAAQSADTMTHPKFRYKGMFIELSNITFELCRRSGIRLIFGFPNQNFYAAAVRKLGWKHTNTMDCFLLPIKTIPLAKLLMRTKLTATMYQKYLQWILKKYKTSLQLIANSGFVEGFYGLLRDIDYQRAKNYHQRLVLEINGALIWCKITQDWVIGDMQVTAMNFEKTMAIMKKIAARIGCKQIQFHSSRGTKVHSLFSAYCNAIPSFPEIFQPFDPGINLEKIKFTLADIDIF